MPAFVAPTIAGTSMGPYWLTVPCWPATGGRRPCSIRWRAFPQSWLVLTRRRKPADSSISQCAGALGRPHFYRVLAHHCRGTELLVCCGPVGSRCGAFIVVSLGLPLWPRPADRESCFSVCGLAAAGARFPAPSAVRLLGSARTPGAPSGLAHASGNLSAGLAIDEIGRAHV